MKDRSDTHQPFLGTLQGPLLAKHLYCHGHATTRLDSCERMLIDPPLKDITKTPFTHNRIMTKVTGGSFQLIKVEALQVEGLHNLTLCLRR